MLLIIFLDLLLPLPFALVCHIGFLMFFVPVLVLRFPHEWE